MLDAREIVKAFVDGFRCDEKSLCRQDKELREHLTEEQIDRMVKDSFPASDPPSTY